MISTWSQRKPIFPELPHFIVFDEADKLTNDAQHALRSSMEKFFSTWRIILLCNNILEIIPALLSRLTVLYFQPLPKQIIVKILYQVKEEEKFSKITSVVVERIAEMVKGDMRLSLE